ncbi:MAG: acyl-CoA dehydrogenase [Rhodospirillaceae bacterium]|nr:MAG: acyl-CoA dehydrogenase [Rhodospirillaceae bacterium]
MSILLREEQQAIAIESERILKSRVKLDRLLHLLEIQGMYDADFWQTMRAQGWTGISVPEEYGGLGLSLVEVGLVAKACGAVLSGAPFLTSGCGVAHAILAGKSAIAKHRWLAALASGNAIGAVAVAEAQNPLPFRPAVTYGNGTLVGTKCAVSAGSAADVAVVLANQDGNPVLAVAALDGVQRKLFDTFDNSRCTADLIFDRTPAEVIADGQEAMILARLVLAQQAVVTAFEQTGGAEAMMLQARDYANTRRAFGQVIGGFQAVKHRIAEMYVLVELARANALHAASREGQPDFLRAAAVARLSATEAYDTCARECTHVHGGIGVTWETGLHLHMRRARTLSIEQGNGPFWEDFLVDTLTGAIT